MKKQDLLKKGSSIALVATLIGSQLMTTIPFNVLAAENTVNAQAVPYNAVTVNNWAELKAALASTAVTDIYFSADITVGATTSVTSTTKNIHGNKYTLNANNLNIELKTANAVALVEDLTITNTDDYGVFWGRPDGIEVTYKNVTHSGREMMFLPLGHLIVDGKVTSTATVYSAFWGKQLTIKDNAIANFTGTGTDRETIYLSADSGVLTVGNNATLTTRSKVGSMYGANNTTIMNYGTIDMQADTSKNIAIYAGNVYLRDGSSLKTFTAEKTHESILVQNGSLFAESGSTLDVTSSNVETAVQTGSLLKLANGSNFSITNLGTGAALGSYSNATDVIIESGQGISTWNVKNVTKTMPDASYPGLFNAKFTLSGYSNPTQTNMTSNNALFASQFKSSNIGKITGGSFSSKAIGQTKLDTVDSDATTVTGTAEPGADIVLKVGTTIIGQGKAGDDGKYSITIPKQAAGVTVTATATWNSQTSDATTVVQKGTADQDAAKKAIDALFTDGTKTDIKPTTDAEAIKNAQDLLDKVQDPTVKETLQKDIDKAKELLAKKAVDELFKNNDPTSNAIKDTTDDQAIKDAKKAVDALEPGAVKDGLTSDLEKAQLLLDAKKEQASADQIQKAIAEYVVNQLFVDNDPKTDAIKTTTNQDAIDNAQKEIDKIKAPNLKKDAQNNLNRAQQLLDERNAATTAAAKKAVDELFINNTPSSNVIKPTTDQAKINAAQALINKVTDPTKKVELQKDLDKAQNLLDANVAVVAPTANAVTNKDKVVTGKGTPGLTAVVKIGTATYTGIVGADGKFSVTIPVQKADTIITVAQKNATKTGPSVNVKVGNYIPATAPIVDEVGPFQQAVTGKAPAGTVSVRLIVNGVPQRLVEPDANGNFSFYSRFVSDGTVSNLRLKMGDIVTVDYGSKTPANLATSVRVSLSAKPIIDTVIAESDYITGLVPTGTQVLRLSINGIPQRTVTPQEMTAGVIESNGRFKIYSRFFKDETGVSRKLQAGDKITVDLGAQIPGDTGTTVTVIAK
ncbi:hypothetical protein HCA64_14150 [Listeria booriae]|uniref:toxin Cry1Ac domain D-VI-related protein n=1 Tax=Listeria booriae TaxID=1552123 RepID=UPI000E065A72|nr:toxin Cry1Ac domain D-VI-related protein [Listeria booriae]MBC1907626.1 hypothetical protein [Listeria booriae]STY42617.1 Uncharacterised protein [Listeria booriae]